MEDKNKNMDDVTKKLEQAYSDHRKLIEFGEGLQTKLKLQEEKCEQVSKMFCTMLHMDEKLLEQVNNLDPKAPDIDEKFESFLTAFQQRMHDSNCTNGRGSDANGGEDTINKSSASNDLNETMNEMNVKHQLKQLEKLKGINEENIRKSQEKEYETQQLQAKLNDLKKKLEEMTNLQKNKEEEVRRSVAKCDGNNEEAMGQMEDRHRNEIKKWKEKAERKRTKAKRKEEKRKMNEQKAKDEISKAKDEISKAKDEISQLTLENNELKNAKNKKNKGNGKQDDKEAKEKCAKKVIKETIEEAKKKGSLKKVIKDIQKYGVDYANNTFDLSAEKVKAARICCDLAKGTIRLEFVAIYNLATYLVNEFKARQSLDSEFSYKQLCLELNKEGIAISTTSCTSYRQLKTAIDATKAYKFLYCCTAKWSGTDRKKGKFGLREMLTHKIFLGALTSCLDLAYLQ